MKINITLALIVSCCCVLFFESPDVNAAGVSGIKPPKEFASALGQMRSCASRARLENQAALRSLSKTDQQLIARLQASGAPFYENFDDAVRYYMASWFLRTAWTAISH